MSSSTKMQGHAPGFRVVRGLATFGPEILALHQALEARYATWARECGARSMRFPPLIRAADLARFDYFRNFPHLAVVTSRIREDVLASHYAEKGDVETVAREDLSDAKYLLPSAACYNVYLDLEGEVLSEPRYVTTVANCYRNENHYEDLERLWSFHMREIVCVGPVEAVQEHLRIFKPRILAFAEKVGLDLEVQFATDPFYQPQSSTARMQKLFPQKEELLFGGKLAIGSLNFHRNFFGERCNITTADGEHAFTSCVAFGIERWIHALLARYDQDAERALAVVEAAT